MPICELSHRPVRSSLALGIIAWLVIGLYAYAPTAPFAMTELGLPAAFCGAFIGLVVGLLLKAAHRVHR